MPWNPVLWWQFWRLRQALELDCDARVLCRAPDRRTYGLLLLEVSRRRCGGGLTTAGLSRPRSFLERRIRMMGKRSLKGNRGRAIAASGIAMGLALLACEAERPTAPSMVEEAAPAATANRVPLTVDALRYEAASRAAAQSSFGGVGEGRPPAILFDRAPEIVNRAEVEAVLVRAYPPSLREAGIGGTVQVWFSIDESGRVTQMELAKSSGFRALDEAAIQVARTIKFAPADLDGQKVAVVIQLPITFRVS
jgi:TonB family protein